MHTSNTKRSNCAQEKPSALSSWDSRTADKLARICGMLGSAHDGERANAAALADRLLRQLKLTWSEVLQVPEPEPERIKVNTADLNLALANPDVLTEWEQDFVQSIALHYSTLTPKQAARLARIANKVRAYTEAAS